VSSPDEDEEREPPQGRISLTGPGPLVGFGVLGLVVGWAVRPLCLRFGYAVAQLGVGDPAAATRLWRSVVAALGAGAVTVAALLLERACRVPDDHE